MSSETQDFTMDSAPLDNCLSDLSSMLTSVGETASQVDHVSASAVANQLVQVRLGVASSLFTALQLRHSPTANHSLRVALICSQWSQLTDMSGEERDELEVAALLHDVGKIGVPDPVLKKPSALSPEQAVAMRKATPYGLAILENCCASAQVLSTVRHVHTWFNEAHNDPDLREDGLPLGSRMIAIADAFDAMTTDRSYRKAMPRERAVAELFEGAGTQFDPELVAQFATLHGATGSNFLTEPAREWLRSLSNNTGNRFWKLQVQAAGGETAELHGHFFEALLASYRDAVIFIDAHLNIVRWNSAAEKLTGISAEQIVDCCWHPKLVGLKDHEGRLVAEESCPVTRAIQSQARGTQSVKITTKRGDIVPVDTHMIPVSDGKGGVVGSVIVFHDKTSEHTWRAQIKTLNDKVARDALTGVANRAEFDRFHDQAVALHAAQGTPCSLIICDIDRFKRVNDELGHQAGDAALVTFAALLSDHCREGDLVARYGGEEFVIVCNECGSVEASNLAEKIRAALEVTELPELNNRCITASFGVTELQPGDDSETMLRRADRGLLQAKETGRNRVVELGTGMHDNADHGKKRKKWWPSWGSNSPQQTITTSLVANVPLPLVAQKLHGFVSDQDANVLEVEPHRIEMQVTSSADSHSRRSSDRPITFHVQLCMEELPESETRQWASATRIDVSLTPLRVRDRRQKPRDVADQLLSSLKSYLMAHSYSAQND